MVTPPKGNTDLVRIPRDVVVPRYQRHLCTLLAKHPDDVILNAAIHRQNLINRFIMVIGLVDWQNRKPYSVWRCTPSQANWWMAEE